MTYYKKHLAFLSVILLLSCGAAVPMAPKESRDKKGESSAISRFAEWLNPKASWALGGTVVGVIAAYIVKQWYREGQSRSPIVSNEINLTGQSPSDNG